MASSHVSPRPIGLHSSHSSSPSPSTTPTPTTSHSGFPPTSQAPTSAPTSESAPLAQTTSHRSMLDVGESTPKRSMLDIGEEYIAKSSTPRAPLSRQPSTREVSQMQTIPSSASIKSEYAASIASSNGSHRTGPTRQNTSNLHPIPSETGAISTLAQTPSRPAVQRAPTNSKGEMHKQQPAATGAPTEKPKLGARMSSFFHRKKPSEHALERNESDTNLKKITSKSSFNNFTFSSRSSATSQSGSPQSPGSPVSTHQESESLPAESTFDKSMQSNSETDLQSPPRPRIGITWGPAGQTDLPSRNRGRSASNEHVPSMFRKPNMGPVFEEDEPHGVHLQPAFSVEAREGAGLKARRLSTALPDEIWVDSIELDKEFQSTSFVPGRRGQLIGKGAVGTVRLMSRRGESKDTLYAVKEFRGKEKHETEEEHVKKLKSEFCLAKSLHHPNIVETVRLCTHNGRWNHVMEYCIIGDLYGLVKKGLFFTHYKATDRFCFFKQVLRGVDYLHAHGIAHRDIKLENVLMDSEGHLKITDFGTADVFSGEHPGSRSAAGQCGKNMGPWRMAEPGMCGSLPYIAPEILLRNASYDPRAADVWATAMLYLCLVYGGTPWNKAQTSEEQQEKPGTAQNYDDFMGGWTKWLAKNPAEDAQITDTVGGAPNCGKFFNSVDKLGSPAIKRILLRMLHPIAERRATIREVLDHHFMRGVQTCSSAYSEEVCLERSDSGESMNGIDASKGLGKKRMEVQMKHDHIPPKEHKTPKALQHRFDMGHGWY